MFIFVTTPNILSCTEVSSCVTAIISTHGRLDAIVRLVESIIGTGYGDMKIVVVNDLKPGLYNFT